MSQGHGQRWKSIHPLSLGMAGWLAG
jgi:hypothetical protein